MGASRTIPISGLETSWQLVEPVLTVCYEIRSKMSALLNSGRSGRLKEGEINVRFRPEAAIHHPFRLLDARVKLANENLGGN